MVAPDLFRSKSTGTDSGAGTAFPAWGVMAEARLTQHQPVGNPRAKPTARHIETLLPAVATERNKNDAERFSPLRVACRVVVYFYLAR